MTNQNKRFWLLCYFTSILAGIFLSAGKLEAQATTIKPGNTSATVELWLNADKGVTSVEDDNGTDNVTDNVTVWADQSGNARDYTATTNWPTYNQDTNLMNFHPSIDFTGGNAQKLIGPASFLSSGNAYYVFYVSQQSGSSGTFGTVYAFNSGQNNNYGWLNGNPSFQTAGTGTSATSTHQGNGRLYGINAVMIPNNSTARPQSYMNGVVNTTGPFTAAALSTGAGAGVIGSRESTAAGALPFNGNIQEIIVLSGVQGNYLSDDDRNKINSYLAVKYGIGLETGDYVNSDLKPVWSRSTNTGYTTDIFGIGRDDASGLNQEESCSANAGSITVFKGQLSALNDSSNLTLSDKEYLMLGSNGASGKTPYVYPKDTQFGEGKLGNKINFISKTIYKAQITTVETYEKVSIQVNDPAAQYVLVSGSDVFDKDNTRIYPATTDQIADSVEIHDGEYITFAGYEISPGGIGFGYATDLWVDGNNSTNTSWDNLAPANYSLDQFSTNPAPVIQNTGYNFNKELYFGNATNAKLQSSTPYSDMTLGRGYCVFVVSKPSGVDEMLLGFNNNTNNAAYASMRWNANSLGFTSYWTTTGRAFAPTPTQSQYGITTLNVANMNGGTLNMYLNGQSSSTAISTGMNTTGPDSISTGRILVGNGNYTTGNTTGFGGSIQEIIILRKTLAGATDVIADTDVVKVHSYLAVKYGITLTSGNYVNSGGTVVWNRTTNADFISNIFGIGRDDNSGLNQVQSRSADNDILTVYKGALNELNDHSSTALTDDNTFLMIGSNGSTGNAKLELPENTSFAPGFTIDSKINYISNTIYKAQITSSGSSGGSQTVNMKVNYVAARYVFVTSATNPTFDKNDTRVYPIVNNVATGVVINDGDLITIAGYEGTPGGINLVTNGYTVDLWVDGNNSTDNSWKNIFGNANYSLQNLSTNPVPVLQNTGYNFNKELYFGNAANTKLQSSANYGDMAIGRGYSVFVVSKPSGSNTNEILLGFNNNTTSAAYANMLWSANSASFSSNWATTNRSITTTPPPTPYGITTLNVANMIGGTLNMYLNGQISGSIPALGNTANTNGPASFTTGRIMIGNGNIGTANTNGFAGSIQEIIVLRKNTLAGGTTDVMADTDVVRIHSYLAVKYGITLTAGNYVSAGGTTVWDRSTNGDYATNIFGIGRDDDSGLNQVQSRSANTDILTVFKGDLNELNDYYSNALTDKTYVMLGSNGSFGNSDYIYPANDNSFKSGAIPNKINYRSNTVYKAQVTNGGLPQTVNIKVNYTFAHDVIVSNDPTFPPASTYVYSITGGIATGVVINDGDFIAIAGFEATPGGLNLDESGYALDLWVDGNNSTNSSWNNLIPANYSLGKFSTFAPVIQNSRFNFNKEMYFGNAPSSKLGTTTNYSVTPGNTYQAFIVSDASTITTNSILLTYNSSTASSTNLLWNNSTANVYSATWNTTARTPNFAMPASARYGITTLNVVNTNNSPLELYLNGAKYSVNLTTGAGGAGNSTAQLVIANGSSDTGTGSASQFNGTIQEIILVRSKSASTTLMPVDTIAKIQSYLAVKYGITIAGNYVNSNNDVVWDSGANSDYNSNIFGLGRDDDSGLYQKQSRSANDSTLTVFRGDEVTALNSDNTGTLDDKQFIMIGRNVIEVSPAMALANANIINDGNSFASGNSLSNDLSNIQSPRYKVQLTNVTSPITVKLMSSSDFFSNVIVSKNDAFNDKSAMELYDLKDGVAEVTFDNDYKYFKFIGSREGPGGVGIGLLLWLQADVSASIGITSLPSSDPSLGGLSTAFVKDTSSVPTVESWTDIGRGHTWTYSSGSTENYRRRPIMETAVREMNYHPAVRFWGNGTTTTYLVNTSGITSTNPSTHTAFFMMNNNFNDNGARIYQMNFTSNPKVIGSSTSGIFYGVEKGSGTINSGFGQGRYRGVGPSTGRRNLFTVGATTIASYYIDARTRKGPRFRFNGMEDIGNTYTFSTTGMTMGSQIGKAVAANRTVQGFVSEVIIYNGLIDESITGIQDRSRLESYLALKYGVTLRPSPNASIFDRFDYKFSDLEDIWPGQTGDSIFINYYNRVAAVIRDDITALNNKQSISTDVGSLLHLGAAGTVLDANGSGSVGSLNNMEAVAFGDNNATGFTEILNDNTCGDFDSRFNRIWLIHKKTENDRPVKIIVGVQNNSDSPIGNDNNTLDYYARLSGSYDVSMIVSDSPDSIQNGVYRQVIPMTYINGVCQCTYEFSDENTYITFGTKPNKSGCVPDSIAAFPGTKTFSWTQWTSRINRSPSSIPGLTLPPAATPLDPVDLGDSIKVLQTQVSYPSDVRAVIGYPRSGSIPVRGSLEVRRSRGALNQDVVVTITFNHPVMPEFSISGLDSYSNYAFEEVEITGSCSGSSDSFMPMLSYASPRNPRTSYLINANKATVIKRGNMAGTNKNGMVNVKFLGSVSTVTIKYRITGRVPTSAMQRIYISPLSFKTVPPPPPVNEDGLSFVKDVKEDSITTCDPVEYSFSIQNTNCETMAVNFSDTLPAKMKWDVSSFVLDTVSNNINQAIEYKVFPATSSYGEILQIDSLQVLGTTTLVLTASAALDTTVMDDGQYDNHATISYDRIVDSEPIPQVLESSDKYTLDPNTTFTATKQTRLAKVIVTENNTAAYKEDRVVTVTYMINNPNPDPIMGMYMDIDFNEEFTYVDGSFSATQPGGGGTYFPALTDSLSTLSIAGSLDGADGFTLPQGTTVITFELKAPDVTNLLYVLDDQGGSTGKVMDLDVSYDLSSTSDDPCIIEALTGLTGDIFIPYSMGLNHVISNKNVTSKIK